MPRQSPTSLLPTAADLHTPLVLPHPYARTALPAKPNQANARVLTDTKLTRKEEKEEKEEKKKKKKKKKKPSPTNADDGAGLGTSAPTEHALTRASPPR